MTQTALAQEIDQAPPVTRGLRLAAHGAWFDRHYRCIPAHDDDGALTVLVPVSLWNMIVARLNGDLGEANREVARRAMESGEWRSHTGAPALVLGYR